MHQLFDTDDEMATAMQPREQCVHLVYFQVERLLRAEVNRIATFQGNRIVGEKIRLKSSHHRFHLDSRRFDFGQNGNSPRDCAQQWNGRRIVLADLAADGFGAHFATVVEQPNVPGGAAILLRGENRNDEALECPRGELDRDLPKLPLAVLTGSQFEYAIEPWPVIEYLENHREETALRENAVIADEYIETNRGVRSGQQASEQRDP